MSHRFLTSLAVGPTIRCGVLLSGLTVPLVGVASAQTTSPAQSDGRSYPAPAAPGTRLGGPGRQPLGASVALRLGQPAAAPLAAPTPATTAKSSFQILADAIDAADGLR